MKKLIYILIWIIYPTFIIAQDTTNSLFTIENENIAISKGSLLISFTVVVEPSTHIATNQMLEITPILQPVGNAQDDIILPAILLTGRNRSIINERYKKYNVDIYKTCRRKNKTKQSIDYTILMPYEPWMNNGNIVLASELFGCADCKKYESETLLATINKEDYIVQPHVAFITPPKEEVKMRAQKGTAYLDFLVNQTTINPTYKQNEQELFKIKNSIELVKNDKNTSITDIEIVGYASPEGSYQNNARLAQGRAEALKNYVISLYNLDNKLINVSSVPEDWAGLKEYVLNNPLENKEEVLSIINSNISEDEKDLRIKNLGNGSTYAFLLKNVYPSLRHSDYTINYLVKDFDIDEAKAVLKSSPQQLSLQEFYIVSQLYPKGSKEFNEIFDVAVRMFPQDKIANANAAAIEIINGNLPRATMYIDKADKNNAAVINNKGVIELLSNNLDSAEILFLDARSKGSQEAVDNLVELQKKRSNSE